MVGHLLQAHPKITNHMALKDTLDMERHCVSITLDEVIALDSST